MFKLLIYFNPTVGRFLFLQLAVIYSYRWCYPSTEPIVVIKSCMFCYFVWW